MELLRVTSSSQENGAETENNPVTASTEAIVSNSASIDVIVSPDNSNLPQTMETESKDRDRGKIKKENIFVQYFRRKTKGLSRSQIAILCILPFVEFFAATVISIQGPFYPEMAHTKGATKAESGLVFGSFELIVFLLAPVYGAKMGVWNPNRIFNYGIFTTSLSCVVFGFLHYIDGRHPFIILSLIVRSIEAVGDAAFVVASFSIIAANFPDSVATTFALMETFYGLGLIAGPTVGGGLYELGGFTLPFAVMGGLLFISAIATYFFITKALTPDPDKVVSSSSFDMFKMLKIPVITLTAYGTFAAATGIGFLNNSLQPHLKPFGVTEWEVGLIFMLNGGVYALTAPFWGKLCDKTSQPKMYSLIGSLLTIAGFMLVGPLPFFPSWEPSILLVCIGLVIFGLGIGATLVSAFIQFLQDAIAHGHPDDVTTHGLVSGLWTSMTALGFFFGPTLGGVLDHLVGFRWGTLFILVEQIILVGLLTYYFVRNRKASIAPISPEEKSEDNLEDIVITYAIKFNTPKRRNWRIKNKTKVEEQTKKNSEPAPGTVSSSKDSKEDSAKVGSDVDVDIDKGVENPNFVEGP